MNVLQKFLTGLVGIEVVAAAVLCGWRLNATLPSPPPVNQYTDAVTGDELLALPDRFLFDSVVKWRTLGEAYMVCGFFSKAEACLHRAAECDPLSAEVLVTRGYCLERLGMLDEAREEFHRAAHQGQREVTESAWYRLGMIFLQLEQPVDARQAFEKAGQEHLPSMYQRAKLLVRSGYAGDAQPLLERLAAGHPEDLRVWQLRARAAEALGLAEAAADARDAAERARRTLELNEQPSLGMVAPEFGLLRELARVSQQQSAGKKAVAAALILQLAREENRLQNKLPLFLQDAAAVQLQVGNVDAARTLLARQIQQEGFPTARAWELYGQVELMEGNPQQAWQDWDRAERLRPEGIDHNKLAAIAQQSGDAAAARKHLALAKKYAGINAFRNNDLPEAGSNLRQAAAIDPDLPDVWFYLGQTERLLGNRTAAEAAYRRCLKLNPYHGRAGQRLDLLVRP